MKKPFLIVIGILIILSLALFFFNGENAVSDELWKNAIYTEDTTLGNGEKAFCLVVTTGEKSITFTVETNKDTVGEALKEVKLIEGEEGPYGIYVKKVNGILADYDIDKSYWSFNQNGTPMQTGVDFVEFLNGETFEFVYTK